jgi:hypothetical protein
MARRSRARQGKVETREEERGFEDAHTFLTKLFHFCPPTRTLTVLSINPADITTPWSSRKVLYVLVAASAARCAIV